MKAREQKESEVTYGFAKIYKRAKILVVFIS